MQCLIAGEGFAFSAFVFQGGAQIRGRLQNRRLYCVERAHGGKRGRCRLAIGFRGAPAGSAIALRGEQVVQRIQREQLAYAGTFAGNQIEFVAIVLADH
ncbi:hypothetical protein PS681_04226 [Pseudomonas fluorescens]|nr:hypothetical protein PS681_04226 [Pseudomonas fluorescens]